MRFFDNPLINVPKIHSGHTLIGVGWPNATDAALGKEDANERWIVSAGPFLNRKGQRVGVVLWRIREFEKTVHGDLNEMSNYVTK